MIAGTKCCLAQKRSLIEVLFDPVPNLDEVSFGTANNQKHRLEVAANLKVPEYACRRGGPSTLEWANIYWANRLVAGLGVKNVVALSLSGEGCKGPFLPALTAGMRLMSIQDARKTLVKPGDAALLILLSPCQDSHYAEARKIAQILGDGPNTVPVVALNSAYSFRYDLGAGEPWTLAYVMVRDSSATS
jgi:hypothetical protein